VNKARLSRGGRYMLFIFVWMIVSQYGLVFAAPALLAKLNGTSYIFLLTESVMFAPPLLFLLSRNFLQRKSGRFIALLSIQPLSLQNAGYTVLMTVFLTPLMMILSGLSGLFFPNPAEQILTELHDAPLWVLLTTLAFTPAVWEELNFRGVIFGEMKNSDLKQAVALNGIFFGLMHMNLQQFPYACAMGIVLTLFVYWTGSILASMLAHFISNALSTLLSVWANTCVVLQEDALAQAGLTSLPSIAAIAFAAIVTLIFFGAFLLTYVKFKAHNQKRTDGGQRDGDCPDNHPGSHAPDFVLAAAMLAFTILWQLSLP
jgi:membrane protease YdiL (CAAX protease family)